METISEKTVKANKNHKCDWCGGKIDKGQLYITSFNKDGGDTWTWKNHVKCMDLYEKLDMGSQSWDGEVGSNEFMEYVYYFLQENMTDLEYDEIDNWGEEAVDRAIQILESL